MNFKLKELYAVVMDEYYELCQKTLDTADFVPPRMIKCIERRLLSAMKASFRTANWENFKYQWALKKAEKTKKRSDNGRKDDL